MRSVIIKSAMQAVRVYGLDGVRIQHIGEMSGCATSNLYAHFSGKDELLQVCFDTVDRQIAQVFDQVQIDPIGMDLDPEWEVFRLWAAFWRWLTTHPDETVFYHRYRDSAAFPQLDKTRDKSHFASLTQSVQLLERRFQLFGRFPPDLIRLHALTATVMYAKYVVEGALPNDGETEQTVFRLLMNGLRDLAGVPASAG